MPSIKQGKQLKLRFISEDFVMDGIKAGALMDYRPYLLKYKGMKEKPSGKKNTISKEATIPKQESSDDDNDSSDDSNSSGDDSDKEEKTKDSATQASDDEEEEEEEEEEKQTATKKNNASNSKKVAKNEDNSSEEEDDDDETRHSQKKGASTPVKQNHLLAVQSPNVPFSPNTPARRANLATEQIHIIQFEEKGVQVNMDVNDTTPSSNDAWTKNLQQLAYDQKALFSSGSDKPLFYDVTFNVKSTKYHAVRAVLCARSDHFREMLTLPANGSKDAHASVDIKDTTPVVFGLILQYIFTGSITTSEVVNVFDVLNYADKIGLIGAKKACLRTLEIEVKRLTDKKDVEESLILLNHMHRVQLQYTPLYKQLLQFLLEHSAAIFATPLIYCNLNAELFSQFLQSTLVPLSEELLFERLIVWGIIHLYRWMEQNHSISNSKLSANDYQNTIPISVGNQTHQLKVGIIACSEQDVSTVPSANSPVLLESFTTFSSNSFSMAKFLGKSSVSAPAAIIKGSDLLAFLKNLLPLIQYEYMSNTQLFKAVEPKNIFKRDDFILICKANVQLKTGEPYAILGNTYYSPRPKRCKQEAGINRASFKYVVKKEELKKERLFLPDFEFLGQSWFLCLQLYQGHLSVYLYNRTIYEGHDLPTLLTTNIQFILHNYHDFTKKKTSGFTKDWKVVRAWGYSNFIETEQLFKVENGFINSDNEITVEVGLELQPSK